jgi:hypothetical protein
MRNFNAALFAVVAMAFTGCGQLRANEACKNVGDCLPTDRCEDGLCLPRGGSSAGAGSVGGSSTGHPSASASSSGSAGSTGRSSSSGSSSASSGSSGSTGSSGSIGSSGSSGSSGSTGSGLSCSINGTTYADQAPNPQDPCSRCDVTVSTSRFTPVLDGTACVGGVCFSGSCSPICLISGSRFDAGAPNPFNICQDCAPQTNSLDWSSQPDGLHCQAAEVCVGGNCTGGCFLDGGFVAPDAGNPAQSCETCSPSSTVDAWSTRPDGFDCSAGQVCASGACAADCFIGGTLQTSGGVDPADPCESCVPSGPGGTHAWTASADGLNSACGSGNVCRSGSCAAGCFIDGQYRAPGSTNPGNPCQVCNPTNATGSWSNGNEGSSSGCGGGQVCHIGACTSGCFISSGFVSPQALNPANTCEACSPGTSTSSYTALSDGATCNTGGGNYCKADTCILGCNVTGTGVVTAGTLNTSNSCQICDPSRATTAFSTVSNGTSCGSGSICFSGNCQVGCDISGAFVASGGTPAGNTCVSCQPFVNTSNYSNLEGQACSSGGNYCHSASGQQNTAVCTNACLISGAVYPNGNVNSSQTCQICNTSLSTTSWSTRSEGTNCASGQVCHNNACTSGCYVSGSYYSPNQTSNGGCVSCVPSYSISSLKVTAAVGTSCNSGSGLCNSSGSCVACPVCGRSCCSPNSCSGTPLRCN